VPIVPTEIKYYRSASATSLGGAITGTELDPSVNWLYDLISGDEAVAGEAEYRCIYIQNTNLTLSLLSPRVFIKTNTPSIYTTVEMGLGTSGVNGVEQTIVNEGTAPLGVVFSTANGYANGLVFPTLGPGQHKAVWLKRIVSPNARAYNVDSVIISTSGGTI